MAEAPKVEHKPPAELPAQAQTQKNLGRPKRTPDEQAEYFYNLNRSHMVFFGASVLLLFSFALMIWDDYRGVLPVKNRDWKEYQKTFQKMELARLQHEIHAIEEELKVDEAKRAKVDLRIAATEEELQLPDRTWEVTVKVTDPKTLQKIPLTENVNLLELKRRRAEIKGDYELKQQDMNFKKSELMTRRYYYEEAEHHYHEARKNQDPRLPHFEHEFRKESEKWEAIQKATAEATAAYDAVNAEVSKIEDQILAVEKPLADLKQQRAKMVKEREDRLLRLNREKPQLANAVRNAPMLDFFDPSIRVQQQLLPDILEDFNFVKIEKNDRCHTCHRGIDNPLYAVDIFPDKVNEEEEFRYQFRSPFLRTFVNHARGRVPPDACDICRGVGEGWMMGLVGHNTWSSDDLVKYTKTMMAHPRLDLYVGGTSKHPLDKVGCTTCHEGDGRETEFSRAVHMPDTDAQWKAWERRHHYHYRELWDHPMYPRRHVYASCRRCHNQQVELDSGDDYVKGMVLYERAGCFACHRTDSYQILPKDLADPSLDPNRRFRRPGPPLTHVADKVGPDWAFKWVMAPKEFRRTTRMPHFFGQSNARTLHIDGVTYAPERVEPVIAAAIVKYLFEVSESRNYSDPPSPPQPADAKRGEAVFRQVGCIACHTTDPDPSYAARQDLRNDDDIHRAPEGQSWLLKEFGPNLSAVGSKFADNPERGRRWLYYWIKHPQHYFPDTRMGDFRATEQELHDLAAYLLTLRKEGDFDLRPGFPSFGDAELNILDRLVFEQLRAKLPEVDAKTAVDAMRANPESKILWYGRKMVQYYGCYSCHELRPERGKDDPFLAKMPVTELPIDWTNIEGIGVELTGSQPEGNKGVDRLAFGHTAFDGVGFEDEGDNHRGVSFEHAYFRKPYRHVDPENPKPDTVKVREFRHLWIRNKLFDPRVFDGGKLSSLPPDELLKMPNFYLNAEEVRLLTTFVLSFTYHDTPAQLLNNAKQKLDPYERMITRGDRLIRENNCKACHRFSLERFEIEWTRREMSGGTAKEVTTWEWVEGLRKAKVETPEPLLKAWGLLPEEGTAGAPPLELYTFQWASDPCTLQMSGAVNPDSQFVLVEGSRAWYLDLREGKLQAKRPIRQWRPMEGGEILDHIVKVKKELFDDEDFVDANGNPLIDLDNNYEGSMNSRFPPLLRSQGRKIQPRWLFDFLKRPYPIRPALAPIQPGGKGPPDLNVRMPTFHFTDEEAESLVKYFWARDRRPEDKNLFHDFPEQSPGYLEARKPVLDKVAPFLEKNCKECHFMSGQPPEGGPQASFKFGPELAEVERRLNPRWLAPWLNKPSEIYPGTTMTAIQFPPDVAEQEDGLKAAVEYMMNYGKLSTPPAGAKEAPQPGDDR
ncbi:MAG: c-type cytochrome [Planctomycetes bacterium]|nr:c-type cytochrome [Planctomycetota bacterium]